MFEKLDAYLDSFVTEEIPGYDCIVYKDGEEVYRRKFGYTDLENKIPVSGNERTNIYSCTKPVTCTAALQMWEKGLYDLDDDLCKYMPEFTEMYIKTGEGVKKAENRIKVRDLFMMTAGFSYETGSPSLQQGKADTEGRAPTREMMKYLAKEPLLFEPGTKWQYSLCHDVLAAFVEVLSGMTFGEYVRQNIFEPLGMTSSTLLLPEDELDTIAQQYACDFMKGNIFNCGKTIQHFAAGYAPSFKLGTEYESGGAGAISTVADFIKYLEGMRTYKLLKPETIKMMMTNQLDDEVMKTYLFNEFYGYGLGVRCPREGSDRTDFGWMGAACSYLAIDIENGITVFFNQHLINSPFKDQRFGIIQYVKEALGMLHL